MVVVDTIGTITDVARKIIEATGSMISMALVATVIVAVGIDRPSTNASDRVIVTGIAVDRSDKTDV